MRSPRFPGPPAATAVALLLLLLPGCRADEDDDDDAVDDDADDDADDDSADDDASGDEAILRAVIEGTADAEEALATVAASGGLPVRTAAGTFLFACTCSGSGWMLAGDHEGWSGQPMHQDNGLWWIEVDIDAPDGSLYKFTDGVSWIADPRGRRYGFDQYGEYSLVRATAAHLERWYGVEGFGLAPRDLQVWVPEGGVFTHALYAHDGNNLFDPEAPWGGWHLDESLPPEMLVVGIDNTADRMEEYTHTTDVIHGTTYGGRGEDYADLVELAIRPTMEAAYGEPDVVGTMGSSLGGLVSLVIGDRYPDRYDMVISLSGTVGWGSIDPDTHNPTIIEIVEAAGRRDPWVYIDSGGGGTTCADADGDGIHDDDPGASDNYCENVQLRDVLQAAGYQFDVDLYHWHEPGATHDEAAWAARVWRPLEIFATRGATRGR